LFIPVYIEFIAAYSFNRKACSSSLNSFLAAPSRPSYTSFSFWLLSAFLASDAAFIALTWYFLKSNDAIFQHFKFYQPGSYFQGVISAHNNRQIYGFVAKFKTQSHGIIKMPGV